MGWDIDRFPEGEVNLELICCICAGILEDPVESPCRHVFCSLCIKTWLSNQKSCPHCRAPVHKKDLQSVVPLLKSIISKQKIYCDNIEKGCNEIVALESLQSHVAVCLFGTTQCTNDGCTVKILRKDLKTHTEVCSKKTIMCDQGCEMFLTLGEKNTHNCVLALKHHFTEKTNELQHRVSKLEELLNVMVSKSNQASTNRSGNNNQHRGQQCPDTVWEPYTIPSPLPPAPSYSLAPDDEESRDIDNNEFTDSEDSLYSMRLGVRVDQVDEGNESPVQRNNTVHWSPQIYNNSFRYSDQEERGRSHRNSRSRSRRTLSPSYNNTFDLNQDNRNREQHRNRSRSPYANNRRHHSSRNRNTSPEYRRPSRRHLTQGGRNEQAVVENNNGNSIRQTGESVVVSIGVSENVSSDSSSSASTSASDSE